MESKLVFVGFGNVARSFARMIQQRRQLLAEQYGLSFRVTAIATARHGSVISREIDLDAALACVEKGESLTRLAGVTPVADTAAAVENSNANVLFETSPLNPSNGEPALSYIRFGLERGLNVVTANKGPLAFGYRELKELARASGLQFRFEGAVMDGAPVFNLASYCLPGIQILGFAGVLNSTTNVILTGIEAGVPFAESLAEAQRRGIAEANADFDIDGWDAAVKAVALSNVLMESDLRPADVARSGIRGVVADDLRRERAAGRIIRLVARGDRTATGVRLSVSPEAVALGTPLAVAQGSTNVLTLKTDLMGELTVIETDPGVEQTAYALLSDWLRLHQERRPRP